MELKKKNWVQLSCDFGKLVPSGTTKGKFAKIVTMVDQGTLQMYCWNAFNLIYV